MSLPRAINPRQKIHKAFCATQYECRYEGARDPGLWCTALDDLLDFNNEMLLHDKALEFETEIGRLSGVRGAAHMGGGLARAVEMVDPFERVEAFDPDLDEIHPGEEHPDCAGCVEGVEHFHRKKDGSLVKPPSI